MKQGKRTLGAGGAVLLLALLFFGFGRAKGEEGGNGNGVEDGIENGVEDGNGLPEPPEEPGDYPVISLPQVDILSVNGVPFIETGVQGGRPYGRLREPIIQDDLIVTVKMRNKSVRLSDASYRDLGLHIFYQMSGGPSFTGRAGVTLYRDEQGYPYRNPPFDYTVTPGSVIGAGNWSPKTYSAELRPFAQYYESDAGQATLGSCLVLDFLQCTGFGTANI